MRRLIVLACLLLSACGSQASTPPPAPPPATITKATFEPVYRASKEMQGASAVGITFPKFSELLQHFSSELSIAKDHPLNDSDKALLALYQDAFDGYQFSAQLWQMQIQASDEFYKGEIPVGFKGQPVPPIMAAAISRYDLPLADRKMQYTGAAYQALPTDAVQRVWKKADAALLKANDRFYGR